MEANEKAEKTKKAHGAGYFTQDICSAILADGAKCKALAMTGQKLCQHHIPQELKPVYPKEEIEQKELNLFDLQNEINLLRARLRKELKAGNTDLASITKLTDNIRRLVDTASSVKDRQTSNADSGVVLKEMISIIYSCVKDEPTRQEIARKLSDLCK